MDTLAPQSVLDSRHRDSPATWRGNPDRLTRAASPGRLTKRPSNDEDIEEVLSSRIDQPYRTSFSAVTTPVKTKRQRSRSTSPGASSMKSDRSARNSNRSSKHVTYNTNVTVRHSDSFENQDSLDTKLAYGKSEEDSSDKLMIPDKMANSTAEPNAVRIPGKEENMEDYSSQIREVTQMIVNEYSNDKSELESNETNTSPGAPRTYRTKPPLPGRGRGRGTPNGRPVPDPSHTGPKNIVAWEYEHDRTINYRKAMSNHYTEDIKRLAKEPQSSQRDSRDWAAEHPVIPQIKRDPTAQPESRMERSSSMPLQPQEDTNHLSPPKKTVSGSIGNFFRRLSPRLGRKSKKNQSTESVSTLSDSGHGGCASEENLSRSKFRQSFKKFLSRSSPKPKGKKYQKDASNTSLQKADMETRDHEQPRSRHVPQSSSRMMESIKQNSNRDRDVYQKFKDRQSPSRQDDTRHHNAQPVRVSGEATPSQNVSRRRDEEQERTPRSPGRRGHGADTSDRVMPVAAFPDIIMDVTPATPNHRVTTDFSPTSDRTIAQDQPDGSSSFDGDLTGMFFNVMVVSQLKSDHFNLTGFGADIANNIQTITYSKTSCRLMNYVFSLSYSNSIS